MKLTTGILLLGMAAGAAWAQNPDVIQDTRSTLQNIQKKETIDQNAALSAAGQAPSAPAASKASAAPANSGPVSSKPVSQSAPVAQSKPAAKPAVSKAATAPQAKPAAKSTANNTPSATPAKPTVKSTGGAAAPVKANTTAQSSKPAAVKAAAVGASKVASAKGKKKSTAITVKAPVQPKQEVAVEDKKNPVEPKKDEPKTYSAAGRRDPFISPVVNRTMTGSGCSTGKRCLAIDQISLQGIVKSESGMIAVVVNALNKAYFLHENDPVFNGYVVRITGDSIIFKETIQDKLGKPFEREVTKKIFTPAV